MGNIEHVAFREGITKYNISEVIAKSRPDNMSSDSYQRLLGYFADSFMHASHKMRDQTGSSDMTRLLSHSANVLGDVKGLKSMEKKAEKNPELFSVLCSLDESFKLLIRKFLPRFEIKENLLKELATDLPPEGKVIPFLPNAMRARDEIPPSGR